VVHGPTIHEKRGLRGLNRSDLYLFALDMIGRDLILDHNETIPGSFPPPVPSGPLTASSLSLQSRPWLLGARPRRWIATDELGVNPDRVGVAVILRASVERIIELQLRSADVVVSQERDRLANDGSNGTLGFVG